MNQTDKKSDIALILKINNTFDLKNVEEAKKVYAYVQSKKPFKTKVGEIFQARLQLLAGGKGSGLPCLFCGKGQAANGIICPECAGRVPGQTKRNEGTERPAARSDMQEKMRAAARNDMQEKARTAAKNILSETGKAAAVARQKISEQMEDENIKRATQKAANRSGVAVKRLKVFWNHLSRRNQIIIVAVFITVCMALGMGGGGDGSGNGSNMMGRSDMALEKVSSQEDAQRVLRKIFPESGYSCSFQNVVNFPTAMFEGEVDSMREYGNYGDPSLVGTYIYHVRSNADMSQNAICWVSEGGRIIGYGSLITGTDNSTYFFRIR